MNILASQIGVDVSLERLDVSIDGGKIHPYGNDPAGCELLASKLPLGSVVHLESSGGYERLVRRTLQSHGFVVKVHNPLRVRRSAQADGISAKTDSIDAKHLSGRGARIKAERMKSQLVEELCDLSRSLEALKVMGGRLRVMAKKPQCDNFSRERLLHVAEQIKREVQVMHKEFERRVKASGLSMRFELVQSVPCAGPNLARVVTCELPEQLEDFSEAQLCAYSSTAPIDDQSGKRARPARIRPANMRIKAALYMPALVCIRRQEWASEPLCSAPGQGQAPFLQAIVAVMRRLFLKVVQVLKRGSAWKAKPHRT